MSDLDEPAGTITPIVVGDDNLTEADAEEMGEFLERMLGLLAHSTKPPHMTKLQWKRHVARERRLSRRDLRNAPGYHLRDSQPDFMRLIWTDSAHARRRRAKRGAK